MKLSQRQIYEEQISLKEHNAPPAGFNDGDKNIIHKFSQIIKRIFALHKFLVAITLGIIFIWATAGQVFLPTEYRFATFMGERMGDMNAEATRTVLPASIEQTNALANEQSNVQIHTSCVSQINASAISVYNDCLQKIDAILPVCEFRRQQILNQSCESYTAIPALPPTPTKGVSP